MLDFNNRMTVLSTENKIAFLEFCFSKELQRKFKNNLPPLMYTMESKIFLNYEYLAVLLTYLASNHAEFISESLRLNNQNMTAVYPIDFLNHYLDQLSSDVGFDIAMKQNEDYRIFKYFKYCNSQEMIACNVIELSYKAKGLIENKLNILDFQEVDVGTKKEFMLLKQSDRYNIYFKNFI